MCGSILKPNEERVGKTGEERMLELEGHVIL